MKIILVTNTTAINRACAWSTPGKQVDKTLMATICKIFNVSAEHFNQEAVPKSLREVDFYLIDTQQKYHRCEVKLMGKGNPESSDGALARDAKVFIADTLSDLSKKQLDGKKILWVELRADGGYQRFSKVLDKLKIGYKPFTGDLNKTLDHVFESMPDEEVEEMAQEIENPLEEAV